MAHGDQVMAEARPGQELGMAVAQLEQEVAMAAAQLEKEQETAEAPRGQVRQRPTQKQTDPGTGVTLADLEHWAPQSLGP